MPALLVAGACEAEVQATTAECQRAEIEVPIGFGGQRWKEDVLVVVDDALVEIVLPRVEDLLRAMVTGDTDEDGIVDTWVAPEQRVAVVRLSEAVLFLDAYARCSAAPLDAQPSACSLLLLLQHYQWAPYGYADDVDDFVRRAMCGVASRSIVGCPLAKPDPEPPSLERLGRVFLITHDDACEPFAESCFGAVDRFLSAALEAGVPSSVSLIAGFGTDLATRDAFESAISADEYFLALARDPRANTFPGADLCTLSSELAARPAPELLRGFAPLLDGAVSVCARDYRPAVAMHACRGFIDYGEQTLPDRVVRRDDGTHACELEVTLPQQGPITQCAQLAGLGYWPFPDRSDGEREVCGMNQIREHEAGTLPGFYLTTEPRSRLIVPWAFDGMPPCIGLLSGFGLHLSVGRGVHAIPGAELRLSCTTIADADPGCGAAW